MGNRLTIAGLSFLALAVLGVVFLVSELVVGGVGAVVATVGVSACFSCGCGTCSPSPVHEVGLPETRSCRSDFLCENVRSRRGSGALLVNKVRFREGDTQEPTIEPVVSHQSVPAVRRDPDRASIPVGLGEFSIIPLGRPGP